MLSTPPLSEEYLRSELAVSPGKTFLVCMPDSSLVSYRIFPGDWLIVDRTLQPTSLSIVVASTDNEPEVVPYSAICVLRVAPCPDWTVWGVVTYSIHQL